MLPETVIHRGVPLPAHHLRFCGEELRDDERFLASAEAEVRRLEERCGLTASTRLLDLGCGYGRLALGLVERFGSLTYQGVDVDRHAIAWCRRHVAPRSGGFSFLHLDLANPRYNPGGDRIGEGYRLPFGDGSFDLAYLFSVFSHMDAGEVAVYLRELARLLAPGGRVFLTAFVEEGVAPVAINPPGYRRAWRGPLHCVRYERGFFADLVAAAGLETERLEPGVEIDGQSGLYLSRP